MIAVHSVLCITMVPCSVCFLNEPLSILLLRKEMQLILCFFSIPLMILPIHGCFVCLVVWLVDLNAQDNQGMTPVHEAAYRGHSKLYQYLAGLTVVDLTIKVDKLTINVASFYNITCISLLRVTNHCHHHHHHHQPFHSITIITITTIITNHSTLSSPPSPPTIPRCHTLSVVGSFGIYSIRLSRKLQFQVSPQHSQTLRTNIIN